MAGVAARGSARSWASAIVERIDAIDDVRPVEARDEGAALAEMKALDDLLPGAQIGGGGERHPRHGGEPLGERRQRQIFGAEIVAPLADAVGLVDGEQRHPHAADHPVEEHRHASAVPAPRRGGRARRPRWRRRCASMSSSLARRIPGRRLDAALAAAPRPGPASGRSAAIRRRRRRAGTAPGSDNTATCRRRSA